MKAMFGLTKFFIVSIKNRNVASSKLFQRNKKEERSFQKSKYTFNNCDSLHNLVGDTHDSHSEKDSRRRRDTEACIPSEEGHICEIHTSSPQRYRNSIGSRQTQAQLILLQIPGP